MQLKREAGDNYSINAVIQINNTPIDITGSTIMFYYTKSDVTKSITGSIIDASKGIVKFSPTNQDFLETGTYVYKIKRTKNGITTTHLKNNLIIE